MWLLDVQQCCNAAFGGLQVPSAGVGRLGGESELDLRAALGRRFEMALYQSPNASQQAQLQQQGQSHPGLIVEPRGLVHAQGTEAHSAAHKDRHEQLPAESERGTSMNLCDRQDKSSLCTPALESARPGVERATSREQSHHGIAASSTPGAATQPRASNVSCELFGQPAVSQHHSGAVSVQSGMQWKWGRQAVALTSISTAESGAYDRSQSTGGQGGVGQQDLHAKLQRLQLEINQVQFPAVLLCTEDA